jgi:Caspase domain
MKRPIAFLLLIALSIGAIAQKNTPKTQSAPARVTQSSINQNNQTQEADDLRLGYDIGKAALTQRNVIASHDGKYLAIEYANVADTLKGLSEKFSRNSIKIFDVTAQRFVVTIKNINAFNKMTFAGNKLVYLNFSRENVETQFKIYDIETNQFKTIPNEQGRYVPFILMYSESNQLILTGSYKGSSLSIIAIDLQNFKEKYVAEIGKTKGSEIIVDPTGKYLACITATNFKGKNQIKLLDISTGKELTSFGGDTEYIKINFDFNGNLVCLFDAGEYNMRVEVISLSNRTSKVFKFPEIKDRPVSVLELNGDNLLWGRGGSTELKVFDINDGSVKYRMNSDSRNLYESKMVRLSNNKYLFYTAGGLKQKANMYFNSSKIFDLNAMQMAGYFYSDGSDSYAIIARDGRVDGDMDALKNVYWTSRKSTEKTYLERTLDKNFTPKLLNQILSDLNLSKATFDIDNVITKIPALSLKSFNNTSGVGTTFKSQAKSNKLEVTVTANAQEIEEVRLHQNGKLIKSQSNNGSSQYSFDVSLSNSFGPTNYFFVTATSKSGIEAEKVKFTVEYSGVSSEAPKLYLLTVGINTYRNPKYNLNYAQADADGVETSIKTNSASIFPTVVTYSIRNDQAIKQNIINALEEIKGKALEQDLLLVYYAGHGVMSGQEAQSRDFFLVPHDVTQLYGRDDMLTEKGISAVELRKYSQSINAQKQVFILDACQSSGALEALAVRGAAEEKAIAQLARSTGTFWITSTGTNQFATEFDKLGHGIFTHTLLEGIKGQGDANQDKKLTVRELSTFVENLVPELTEKLNGTPQFPSAYSFGNDFILTIYK